MSFPEEAGIVLIRGVLEGKSVTPYYDSMIFQLIAHAPSRAEAIVKLRNYLERVEIRGVSTNIPLLKRILMMPYFNPAATILASWKGLPRAPIFRLSYRRWKRKPVYPSCNSTS